MILVIVIISSALLFIVTLQIFEYRPDDLTILSVEQNLEDLPQNYIQKNQDIKILTFNIGYASLSETEDFAMDGGSKGRMDSKTSVEINLTGIADIITASNPDLILLQEVDVDSDRSYNTPQYSYFAELSAMPVTLGYNYRCIFVPFPFNPSQMMGKVNSGIMTATNYYVSDATRVQLPGSFSWPLRLANLKRCAVITRIPIDGSNQELIIINVHLSAYDDGTMRLQEMAALQELMQTEYEKGNYVIVGGDFNQTFPGAYTQNLDGYDYLFELKNPAFWQAYGMDDAWFNERGWQFAIDLSLPTCRLLHQAYDTENPSNNQYYLIDGFIVSANIEIRSVITRDEKFKFSDHNPVELIFRIKP
jgi:endonuclease/exonuclease/phosphatase family metal-dependent hydrolase